MFFEVLDSPCTKWKENDEGATIYDVHTEGGVGINRVTHLLANLGWVGFDLGCSTIVPSCSTSSASFPSAQAEPGRGWNSHTQSQFNPRFNSRWVTQYIVHFADRVVEGVNKSRNVVDVIYESPLSRQILPRL